MEDFKKYIRIQIAEMRPVTDYDIDVYRKHAGELIVMNGKKVVKVSISDVDKSNGSPKIGDMIARNPKNHNDQWLVGKQYFEDNFEPLEQLRQHNVTEQSEQLTLFKCPNCGKDWDIEKVNSCECGASVRR